MAHDGLLPVDRCDRCGAQAHHRVTFTASDLLFCAHHYRAHQEHLDNHIVALELRHLDGMPLTAGPADVGGQ